MRAKYGLIGEKLGHSLSPNIHSLIFKELKILGKYKLYEFEKNQVKDIISTLKGARLKGFNVTIPYKVLIMDYLDFISEEAQKIGAINTVLIKDNKAHGYNTDYFGFGMTLEKYNINPNGKKAIILGSGGAAKSTAQYLKDKNAKDITIVSRNKMEAKRKLPYRVISYQDITRTKNQDIIINATPCGMYPKIEESPLKTEHFKKFNTAIDLVYNPIQTVFLKQAKEQGLVIVNGLYMLVCQAIKAQEIWNNIAIDYGVIERVYNVVKDLANQC